MYLSQKRHSKEEFIKLSKEKATKRTGFRDEPEVGGQRKKD